jgi:hypothetical protein
MPREASSKSTSRSRDDSEINARKKKNALAQAAFRGRRTLYIQTLEETGSLDFFPCSTSSISRCSVTNLESVILCLQGASRERCTEMQELKSKHARLGLEYQAREMFWREWGQSNSVQHQLPEMPPFIVERMRREVELAGGAQYQRNINALESSGMVAIENLVVLEDSEDSEHDHRRSFVSHESTTENHSLSQYSYDPHCPSGYGLAANVDHRPSFESPANVDHRPLEYGGPTANGHNRPSYEPPANVDHHSSYESPANVDHRPLEYGGPPANAYCYKQPANADHHSSEYNNEPTASVDRISRYTYPLPLRFRSSPEPISAPSANPNHEMSHTPSIHVGSPFLTRGLPHGEGTSHNGTAASDRYVSSKSLPNISFGAQRLPIHQPTPHAGASTSTRSHTIPATAVVSRRESPPPMVDTVAVLKGQCFGPSRRPRKNSQKPPVTVAETVSKVLDSRGLATGISVNLWQLSGNDTARRHEALSMGA